MYYDDSVIEQSTEQKLLWHLLPVLCLVYMAGMLNRLSLGYAAPALSTNLRLSDTQMGIAGHMYGVGYLLASLPAAWFLVRVGPRFWITATVLATGVIALAQALVWDAGSLYVVRLLLGAAEASLLPAMVFYLVQWMPERHRAKAIGAVIASAALVPLPAAPGSDLLLWLGQLFDLSNWRFLFVVEGLPTLWLGLLVTARTPQAPAEARWLPPSERIWLVEQLSQAVPQGTASSFADGLRSAKLRKLAAVQVIIGVVAGSLGMWVPLAMQQTGYVPPDVGSAIMIAASAAGVVCAVVAGLLFRVRSHWRRALAVCLVVAGFCLGMAAVLPSGVADVLMLAIVAAITPAIVVLTWVLAPCVLAGAAVAAGLAALGMAGTLGDLAAAGLVVAGPEAGVKCLALALACFVAAWLVRGLDGRHPAEQPASAVSPGE